MVWRDLMQPGQLSSHLVSLPPAPYSASFCLEMLNLSAVVQLRTPFDVATEVFLVSLMSEMVQVIFLLFLKPEKLSAAKKKKLSAKRTVQPVASA
jgi:hypothetical protein